MNFYACLLVVSWVSSLVVICAVYVAAPRPLHPEDLVKGLAARCRSSVPEVGRSPALTKGIGRHWMIVRCERPREKRNRRAKQLRSRLASCTKRLQSFWPAISSECISKHPFTPRSQDVTKAPKHPPPTNQRLFWVPHMVPSSYNQENLFFFFHLDSTF